MMFITLKFGDRNTDVLELQRLLNRKLFPCPNLLEDGKFGPKTHKAVKFFQQSVGQTSDGVVSPWTWIRLFVKRAPVRSQLIRLPLPQRSSKGPSPSAPSTPIGSIAASSLNAAPWMEIVKREYESGITRVPGKGNNSRILEYFLATSYHSKTDEEAWCSAFANWVMREAGYKRTNDARAKSWKEWGKALEEPREGAIAIVYNPKHSTNVSGYHVSFFVSQTKTHIYLFGGNQTLRIRDKNGKVINKIKSTISKSGYPKTQWEVFYRWPTAKDKL